MKRFKDFGIKPKQEALKGDRINIERLFGREIIVHSYYLKDSKFPGKYNKCLWLQLEVNNEMRVCFVGSFVLADAIERIPKENFPFTTTIIKDNQQYQFT